MRPPWTLLRRRTSRFVVLTLVLLVLFGAIGLSPFMLDAYQGRASDWERRSFIGQTYGAASAILAVLALIGIVITMRLQAYEARLAREEARRAAISELLKMAMEDPDLDEAWGPVPAGQDHKARKQALYINMIISEWQMSFETGALGPRRLRAISGEMFQGRPGRAFWAEAGPVRLATSENPTALRFHQILDEEYRRAGEADPPLPPPSRRRSWLAPVGGMAAAVTLYAIGRAFTRRRR